MANSYNYSNTAQQTTLTGSVSAGATTIQVAATTGFPTSYPYVLAADYGASAEELMLVTSAATTTLTVTRGFGGTSAQSHSLGAVVRHVVNAQDLTDFRTHEAATGAVHGVAGTLVGTSDVQTLANKTLTAPTINTGALSGTFTGDPTLSGNVTFSGTLTGAGAMSGTFSGSPTFSGIVTHAGEIAAQNLIRGTRALSTDTQYETRVSGDGFARWYTYSTGAQWWGSGLAAADTNLYRSAANTLKTDDTFVAAGNIAAVPTDVALNGLNVSLPAGTVGDLLNLQVNSTLQAAMDSGGQFRSYGGNAPTSYTPTWAGVGTATFSQNDGYYWRIGKMVFVCVFAVVSVAGSGSSIVTVTMPSNVDRSTRQCLTVHAESVGAGGSATSAIRGGECVFLGGGTGAIADRIRVDQTTGNEGNILGNDLLASGSITIQGWYREA